jgi:anti-sigma regulatory factor (Ser/Thr protein kinase)
VGDIPVLSPERATSRGEQLMSPAGTTVIGTDQDVVRLLEQLVAEATGRGYPRECIDAMRTSIEEACRNALEHGDPIPSIPASVSVTWEQEKVGVVVTSSGPPFEIPTTKPDLHQKMEGNDRPRGWGVFLIRSLADEVTVRSRDGVNDLRMKFAKRTSNQGDERG